jgi:calcineurin-like phosphoesterase family protein
MIFFTADTHFTGGNHYNILLENGINYTPKENSASAIDERIIENWNRVVGADDIVYVIGDFGYFRTTEDVDKTLARLNGTKVLIAGNHDNFIVRRAKGWNYVKDRKVIKIKYKDEWERVLVQEVVLDHYAGKVWYRSGHGTWQLHGHSHGTLPDDPCSFQCDVGVDAWNCTPACFAQIREVMKKKYYVPADYHGHTGLTTIPDGPPKPVINDWYEDKYTSKLYDYSDLFDNFIK